MNHMRLLNPLAIAQSIRAAYPRRYVKMVLLGEAPHKLVFVALEADEVLEQSVGFSAVLDLLTPSMWQLQLERARNAAEAAHG